MAEIVASKQWSVVRDRTKYRVLSTKQKGHSKRMFECPFLNFSTMKIVNRKDLYSVLNT